MKHMENSVYELNEMKRELELDAVPGAVERRLRQVFAELPEELPVRRRPLRTFLKTTACTAASLAVAFGLLVGVNAANPALAESIPLIGGIFQRFNEPGPKNVAAARLDVQKYAEPIEGVSVQVPAGGLGQKPLNVTVREAYFDGEFLYAGLELEASENQDWLYNQWGPGYDVLFQEENQRGYDENGFYDNTGTYNKEGFVVMGTERWQRDGDDHYISQQMFRVPEEYRDLDQLEVTLGYNGILSRGGLLGGEATVNSTPFTLSFRVGKNDAQVLRVDGNTAEAGGVKLISASASPAGTSFVADIPNSYDNPAIGWQFEDGTSLGSGGQSTFQSPEEGFTRRVFAGGGFREDEDRAVRFYVFDKNGSSEYEAVFLVDFRSGTVEVQGPEDMMQAPSAGYACGWDKLENLTEGYQVTRFFAGEDKNTAFVATPNGYRELRAELYQDGELVDTCVSENSEQAFYSDYLYWDTQGGAEEEHETNLNAYILSFGTDVLDLSRNAEVKLYDAATNELLTEEELVWNQPNQ